MQDLIIREMIPKEVELALELAATEGWNPGIHDAEIFYKQDPDGFFVAELNGEAAGTVSAVRYGSDFGFIGLFIVKPEYRTLRIGRELGLKALEFMGDRNVGLDGVVERIEEYEQAGFKFAHKNIRYSSVIRGSASKNILPATKVPFEDIARFDRKCFPAHREIFLNDWIKMPDAHSVASVHKNELKGFGTIRKCLEGYKVGPLFANNIEVAEEILLGLAKYAGKEPLYLDIPDTNSDANELVKKYQMKKIFETARMYNRKDPEIDTTKIFGITTFELG